MFRVWVPVEKHKHTLCLSFSFLAFLLPGLRVPEAGEPHLSHLTSQGITIPLSDKNIEEETALGLSRSLV
jgi:hypothetical protein